MASLLPHGALSYDANGAVLVDGRPTSGIANRQKILESVDGMAVNAEKFMAMKKDEGREFIKPYRVVYVYHNQIDAIGDTGQRGQDLQRGAQGDRRAGQPGGQDRQQSERQPRAHHRRSRLSVSGNRAGSDRQEQFADKPAGTVAKKRYLLGKSLPDHPGAYHGSTASHGRRRRRHGVLDSKRAQPLSLRRRLALRAWRGHAAGDRRAGHPVTHVKDKKASKDQDTRHVGVSVLGNNFKITTNRHRFQLIQTEPVGERVKPLTLKWPSMTATSRSPMSKP